MELVGRSLYVVRNVNRQVAKVRLSADFSTGAVVSVTRNPQFEFPTAAIAYPGSDELRVYYGGADTVFCLATAKISDLIHFAKTR